MAKFAVGDHVKTRDDLVLGQMYGGLSWLSKMPNEGVISHVIEHRPLSPSYKIKSFVGNEGYFYSEEMLEPIDYGRKLMPTSEDNYITFGGEMKHFVPLFEITEAPSLGETTTMTVTAEEDWEKYTPKRILKSGNRTIVFWEDGTKTMVKRSKKEADNLYSAFTAALAIKIFGTNSKLQRMIKRKTEVQISKKKQKQDQDLSDQIPGQTFLNDDGEVIARTTAN